MTYSLVIPTYNGADFIEQSLLSVLGQVHPFDEIIISDDNSSDRTLEICEKYKNKVKIFKNLNGPSGFVGGWNHAISKANSDFISILHQDDLLDPNFLFEAGKILETNTKFKHFFTSCSYIDKENSEMGFSYPNTGQIVKYSGLEYVKAYQNLGSPHIHRCPGVFTHRSIFEKISYRELSGHIADDDFFYRVGMYTDVVGLLKPLASFRIHKDSVTGKLADHSLVKQLIKDYKYQIEQWKGTDFLDKEALDYFKKNLRKFQKRYLGYGIKQLDYTKILYALR